MTPYDALFHGLLTRVDPELAHRAAFRAIRTAGPVLAHLPMPPDPVTVMGLDFPNRLGLAAGFDKNAEGIDALAALGFGFVEIGTVTARPQPGNPRPRLARLPADLAVVNRMGFNNDGAQVVATRLAERKSRLEGPRAAVRRATSRGSAGHNSRFAGRRTGPRPVLGVNIGKSKVVPEDDEAAVLADYGTSARLLAPYADYLVVNVSSPNTPGLRNLQAVDRLRPILSRVRQEAGEALPLLVKIAPDLADDDIAAVADLVTADGLDGIVATNTTIGREGLRSSADEIDAAGSGGLSGAPLKQRAGEVTRLLRSRLGRDRVIIGVGGISTPDDAQQRLVDGADLVQAYTGFIYGGPLWPRRVAGALR